MRGVYYRLYLSLFLLLWRDGNLLRRIGVSYRRGSSCRRTTDVVRRRWLLFGVRLVAWVGVGVARGAWDDIDRRVVLGGSRYVYET